MWQYFNPNPIKKRIGDCTVRAISIATGMNWEDTYTALALQGFLMCDMPSSNIVWGTYLKKKGFNRYPMPESEEVITVSDFCKMFPEGIYILALETHVVTCINGDYFDTWDSGDEMPIYYFYKENVNERKENENV